MTRPLSTLVLVVALLAAVVPVGAGASGSGTIGVNVLLTTDITPAILADLGRYGRVRATLDSIDAVIMRSDPGQIRALQRLPYVAAVNRDAERQGAPIDAISASDFAGGGATWDLDAMNVANIGTAGRSVAYDGGVYVAVLDTGLVDSWRQYFPEERIAVQFAKAFSGGGGEVGAVSEPPNQWEHDQDSHGTHVTSTILGFQLDSASYNGVAPRATVIPVKVLGQAGFGWSSMIAQGIVYITGLKRGGALGTAPVVINMSLGGPALDAVERAAIDYAVASGVIVVAAAGNDGEQGMSYPAAYALVISVAASGWVGEWTQAAWWRALDVADPTRAADFYITDFSSRAKAGQDLDVAAPGSWVVGPYQLNSGQLSYFYLPGASMASPHVAGIVALMARKQPALTAGQAEAILEKTAIPLAPGCRTVAQPDGPAQTHCWGANATGSGLATAGAALKAVR